MTNSKIHKENNWLIEVWIKLLWLGNKLLQTQQLKTTLINSQYSWSEIQEWNGQVLYLGPPKAKNKCQLSCILIRGFQTHEVLMDFSLLWLRAGCVFLTCVQSLFICSFDDNSREKFEGHFILLPTTNQLYILSSVEDFFSNYDLKTVLFMY